jgi:hypothetical protein
MKDIFLWIAVGVLVYTFYQMLRFVWGDDE